MADSRIVDYIREQSAAGFPRDAIRKALQEAGWFDDEIDQAFSEVFPEPGVPQAGSLQQPGTPSQPQAAQPQPLEPQLQQPQPQQPQPQPQEIPFQPQTAQSEQTFVGVPLTFLISLVSGLSMIINSIAGMLSETDILSFLVSGFSFSPLIDSGIISLGDSLIIGIVAGISVIVGSLLIKIRPEKANVTSILFIVLSVIAIILGNGYMVGGVIGILAGILGVLKK